MWRRFAGLRGGILAVLVLAGGGVGTILAQQADDSEAERAGGMQSDSLELVFEREVFNYPLYERRNPFRPLGADEASGPRFEDMVFLGTIMGSDPAGSIALVGARFPGATSGQPAARTYRLRLGDTLGNVRVLEIRTDAVVVEVDDFGVTETRMLQRRAEPPPRPPATPEPEDDQQAPAPEEVEGDTLSDPAGQARNDDANGDVRLTRLPAAHTGNGNGEWS